MGTQEIHEPETLHPKKYLASKKFFTPKSTRPSTSLLIYSIEQTLRPKKIHDRSLDPKKYRGCTGKFSTQKNTSDLPVMYTASTSPGIRPFLFPYFCSFTDVDNAASSRPKRTATESSDSPLSPLKWVVILIVLVLALVAAVYFFRINQKDSKINQDSKPQTVETETKTSESKTKKKTKKTKQSDSQAAITNSFDKSISKELEKAQSVLDKGQIADAVFKFETLANKYPKSPRAMYGKAQSLDKLSELKQSNEILQQSIDAYSKVTEMPNCPAELKRRVVHRQADRLSFLGKSGQAAYVLKKLLNELPGDVKLMNELGVQYLMSGRSRDAEHIYSQVSYETLLLVTLACSVCSVIWGPGGYSIYWPIRGGSPRKGYLFQASGISKGRDFTSLGI